jgi:cytochrome c biogenesis protein CcdA
LASRPLIGNKSQSKGDKVDFYWPSTNGEWLAWASALMTIFFGLTCLFAPRLTFRLLRLQTHQNHPEALSESRATMAGFYLGLGLCCILLAQSPLWIALGVSWGFTAFGRLISMLSDDGNTLFNWISVAMEAALALMPLAYALKFIA